MESELPEPPVELVEPLMLPLPRNAQAEWDARRAARDAERKAKEERVRRLVTQGMVNRGPGSEWAKILLLFGVNPWTNKAVREILVKLDKYGPEWCEVNRERIGEWLRAASGSRP